MTAPKKQAKKSPKKAVKKNAKNSKKIVPQTNGSNASTNKPPKKKRTKTDIKKDAMIKALEKTLGVVTTACTLAKCSRTQHYVWLEEDAEYRKRVEDLENVALDFGETKLHKNIEKGDTTAIIFFLKTKGKRRGYIERTEHDHSVKKDTDIPVIEWVSTQKDGEIK